MLVEILRLVAKLPEFRNSLGRWNAKRSVFGILKLRDAFVAHNRLPTCQMSMTDRSLVPLRNSKQHGLIFIDRMMVEVVLVRQTKRVDEPRDCAKVIDAV